MTVRYRFVAGPVESEFNFSLPKDEEFCNPVLLECPVISLTPKGAWVQWDTPHFVLNGPGKRFAHETKQWALESFYRRRQHYIAHLARELRRSELVMPAAKAAIDAQDWERFNPRRFYLK